MTIARHRKNGSVYLQSQEDANDIDYSRTVTAAHSNYAWEFQFGTDRELHMADHVVEWWLRSHPNAQIDIWTDIEIECAIKASFNPDPLPFPIHLALMVAFRAKIGSQQVGETQTADWPPHFGSW
jgi:hypothetical protein